MKKYTRNNENLKRKFIEKSKKIYGEKLDYSKVVWVNNRTPVILKCLKHNIEFEQKPITHYFFNGCPHCTKEIKSISRSLSKSKYIDKLKKIYGELFDYENMVYTNMNNNVTIRCKQHNYLFTIQGKKLLVTNGCVECCKEKNIQDKNRRAEKQAKVFVKKATEVHKYKYDYSKIKYINTKTKVCIICPKHGEFWQTPNKHLSGQGCQQCYREQQKLVKTFTNNTFIEKANLKHNNRYDYSLVEYKNNNSLVKIICPKHGVFEQKACVHLNGSGCQKCAQEARIKKQTKNTKEFIEKANKIHNNKYDYSNVKYINRNTIIEIICPKHGKFNQLPSKHLSGHGCPKCGGSLNYTTEVFINKAQSVHGKLYDYSKTEYVNNKTKVKIICHNKFKNGVEHGIFIQEAASHLSGIGCPKCSLNNSENENEINIFIESLGFNNIQHERNILKGKELDIFIPEKKIGIEYNGLIWHSEKFGKDKNYHLNKTIECEKQGIRLIHIFEDEWLERKDIVKSKLKHILGCDNDLPKVYARKCLIKAIDYHTSDEFLTKNHIQGGCKSTVYLGCYHNDRLIGVMTFKQEVKGGDKWELTRFASDINQHCIGVGGKLFKYFLTHYNPSEVKSFADRRWTNNSNNNLYTKLGFCLNNILKPDYKYVISNKRLHKFSFRKQSLLKKYPNCGLTNNMTEFVMTQKLGFYRIWDCGLFKYVWFNKSI